MTPWVDIATLTQPKGVKGRLGARRAPGLFASLEGLEVFCAPPALEGPRTRRVVREGQSADGECWVELSGVDSRDEARRLIGRHCFVRRDELAWPEGASAADRDETPLAQRDWRSWRVVDDESGFSGEVVDVQERPMQPLLIVEAANGTRLMAPLAEELVVAIDDERRELAMALPEGLAALSADA